MKKRPNCSAILVVLLGLWVGCQPEQPDAQTPSTNPSPTNATPTENADVPDTNIYEIRTPHGRMVIRLYDETPRHRDNFKKLVAEHFYDSTTFHRVIDGFVIQGGDPNSRDDDPNNDGEGGPGYTLPAEFHPELFHKRGAVAAARQGDPVNPERRSSGSQFYIVQGSVLDDSTLTEIEATLQQRIPDADFAFADSVRTIYTTEGGAPFLDQQYTVFGELVEGFDVLDRIAQAETPRRLQRSAPPDVMDRPLEPIPMTVRPLPSYEQ